MLNFKNRYNQKIKKIQIMKNKHLIINILTYSILVILLLSLISILGGNELMARPGGGHSYSGGGGGYSGGGGDGGGLIILLLMQLPPQISIPLILGIIIFRYVVQKRKKNQSGTVSSAPPISSRIKNTNKTEHSIESLKQKDPNFSEVVFLDFVASLYNKYYSFFGKPEFKNISPFLSKTDMQKSASVSIKQDIKKIVIGSLDIKNISTQNDYTRIEVEIRANYTLIKNRKSSRLRVVERWSFKRKAGVLSLEPEAMRRLTCPSCGGSTDFTDSGTCSYCGSQIEAGEKQWFLNQRRILVSELFNTSGLAHYETEQGTSLPTVYQSGLNNKKEQFAQRAGLNWESWSKTFKQQVISSYFFEIYRAWSQNDLGKVRNLLTDRTHENFSFWLDAYEKNGMRNRLENVQISDIRIAKIELDKFYDSITVRIFASALDYVTDKNGKVIGGSSKRARKFSEYWTLIRRSGVKTDSFDHTKCPSCGAPADNIGQAGICEYCNSKISTGDFSWVLAIITQDEEYTG